MAEFGPSHASWLLSKEEVVNSPSRADGIAHETELMMRNTSIAQLMTMGQKKEIKKQVIATACVLFHRFFSRRSMKRFDRFEVALACLVVAGKTVDFVQPVLFRAIVPEKLARQGHNKPVPEDSDLFKATKEQLIAVERQVLSALEFDVSVDLPFQHVDALAAAMGLAPAEHPLRELAIKMLNDVLKTPLVLQYSAPMLAQTALLFAKSQLDKLHASGKGPNIPVPPAWGSTVTLAPELAGAIMAQFTECLAAAKRELEKAQAVHAQQQQAAAAAGAGAKPA